MDLSDLDFETSIDEAISAASFLKNPESILFIKEAASRIATCFEQKGKLLIAGNGGSLCDAMHFAEEFTGQFRARRTPLPAIALSDPAHMSCTANDMGFSEVFRRLVEAYGKENDLLIVLSTSGLSKNLILAHEQAKKMGLSTIAFLGKTGGALKSQADLEWIVTGFRYSDRIQEVHMAAAHIIIEMVEKMLFVKEYLTIS
ncbi:MAG: SIS domain-containing protein [Chlamydiota bacterium]